MMHSLTNELLIKSYITANKKKMDPAFISLLKEEIDHRGIEIQDFLNMYVKSN
jgi:hypothetical protein